MTEGFDNIPENIGNHLCDYFYKYILTVCDQKDFSHPVESSSDIIRHLPTFIPFNRELYQTLKEKGITSELVKTECSSCIWYCKKQWIFNMWNTLRPIIHKIIDDALKDSGLHVESKYPIIHFRCADTPFVKHPEYFFQKYAFFKTALDNYKDNNKRVILMSNSTHLSENKEQEACSKYTNMLKKYIQSIGYECTIQSKTNVEDFADLFYAPYVISTGSSFSFMAGFFGKGTFISTEHCSENDRCDVNANVFIKGFNIHHSKINSYYDTDIVETILQ